MDKILNMNVEYIKENYYFETLTPEHDLSNFCCDSKDLTDFLKNDALIQQQNKLNLTKLIICNDEIIGFVSLLSDTLILKNIREKSIKTDIKKQLNISNRKRLLPAIKIGRFAIHKKYTNKGLGSHILVNIIHNLNLISKQDVGFRYIIVEGYAKAINFYVKKNGFRNLTKDYEELKKINKIVKQDPLKTFYLYFDLKELE